MSDKNVRTRIGHHVYAAHIDLRKHGVLLLYEEMDDSEENDGIEMRQKKKALSVLLSISHGRYIIYNTHHNIKTLQVKIK